MRTRRYMAELVGGEGNVLKHHVKPQELEKKLEAAHVSNKDAQEFMKQLTSDQEGWAFYHSHWVLIILSNNLFCTVSFIYSLGRASLTRTKN